MSERYRRSSGNRAAISVGIAAACLVLGGPAAQAQAGSIREEILAGPILGLTSTTLASASGASAHAGLAAGVESELLWPSGFFLRSGLIYVQRGAAFSEPLAAQSAQLNEAYLEIPALIGGTFDPGTAGLRAFLLGGGLLGVQASCSQEAHSGGLTESSDCQTPPFEIVDLAIVVGGGLQMVTGRGSVTLDARYAYGEKPVEQNTQIKNRGFTFSVGYLFYAGH